MTNELVNRVDVGGVGENKISASTSSTAANLGNFGEAEDSIDAQELAALLEQSGGTESGCAQIVDGEGNLITLTSEQLSAAGIDIANLGESDVETLLQLAQGAHVAVQRDNLSSEQGESDILDPEVGKSNAESAKKRSIDFSEEAENASKKRKFSPANVASSSSHVTAEVEDIGELDEQTLATLVQSGSVKFVDEEGNEIPASAVLVGGAQVIQSNVNKGGGGSMAPKLGRVAVGGAPVLKPQHYSAYSLIGAEVDVKRGNRLVPATVRYIRPGVGFKVQFDDGRFEWVGESDVTPRSASSLSTAAIAVGGGMAASSAASVRDEAEGQSGGPAGQPDDSYLGLEDDNELDDLDDDATPFRAPAPPPAVLTGSRPPRSRGRPPSNGVISTYAGRRTAYHHQHSSSSSGFTPSSGRLGQGYNTRSGQPGIKSPPASILSRHHSSSCAGANSAGAGGGGETNFICPVCERKVYNKEPSYIVIRLPACDECAESKILVLDEQNKL